MGFINSVSGSSKYFFYRKVLPFKVFIFPKILILIKLVFISSELMKSESKLLVKKQTFFWMLQTIFWFIYFVFVSEFIYGSYPFNHYVVSAYCFFYALSGVPASLLLRKIYDSKYVENLSKFYLLFVVIVSSAVLSHSLMIAILVLDYFLTLIYGVPTYVIYLNELIIGTIVLTIWSVCYLLINSWYELSAQKENIERAELLARNAQLSSLRYQLNPHFLFNALNSVRALIYKSPSKADEMISKLSDFMRYTLTSKDEKEIPLEREIDVLRDYLKIEKTRFGEKLSAEINIEPIANEYPIPPFIVIPLVENAIKYGMKTSGQPLQIIISGEVNNDALILEVRNSGHWYGASNDYKISTQTGIKNIKDRLNNLYPGKHDFEFEKTNEFVAVKIKIFRELSYE